MKPMEICRLYNDPDSVRFIPCSHESAPYEYVYRHVKVGVRKTTVIVEVLAYAGKRDWEAWRIDAWLFGAVQWAERLSEKDLPS